MGSLQWVIYVACAKIGKNNIQPEEKKKNLSLETQHYIKAPTKIIIIIIMMIKVLIIADNNYNFKNNNSIQPQCGLGILDEVSPK